MTPVAQLLTTAAEMARTHGMTKRVFVNEAGQMCLRGVLTAAAIGRPLSLDMIFHPRMDPNEVLRDDPIAQEAVEIVRNAIVAKDDHRMAYGDIAGWFNTATVTSEEAIALLDECAKAAA